MSVSPSLRSLFAGQKKMEESYIRHVTLKSPSPTCDGYSMAVLQRSVLKIFILPFKIS